MAKAYEAALDPRNTMPVDFISATDPMDRPDMVAYVGPGKTWKQMESDTDPWGSMVAVWTRNADHSAWIPNPASPGTGGGGSGLDADTLDGIDSADFVQVADVGVADGVASLDSGGKVPAAQLPASVVGAVSYQGTWNATTNTPAIPAAAAGNKGWYYRVATAGTTSIDGVAEWAIGDWIVSNGTIWEKIDNTESGATGGAGGDLTGTYPNPTLAAVGTAGTYPKVTTDAKGRVTAGAALVEADVPNLPASKITSGAFLVARLPVGTTAADVAAGNDGRLSDSRAPAGAAGGNLGGNYPNPDVRKIREAGGPTELTLGAVADGQYLKRDGATLVGGSPSGGSGTEVLVGTISAPDSDPDAHTATNTWEDIEDMSVALTPGGTAKMICTFTCTYGPESVGADWDHAKFQFTLDGTGAAEEYSQQYNAAPANSPYRTITIHHTFTGVTAAAHTVKVQIHDRSSGQDNTIYSRCLTIMSVRDP